MRGIIKKIRKFADTHKVAASLSYVAAGAVLLVLLAVIGVIPGFTGGHAAAPAADTTRGRTVARPAPKHHHATAPGVTAEEAANRDMKLMNATLDQQTGVNGATLRQYLLPQEADEQSEYSQAEYRFTDLVKAATTPGSKGAKPDAGQIDRAYDSWQAAAWKAANDSLHDSVVQMLDSARPGRDYLKAHRDYPPSCGRYAAYTPTQAVGTTRDDFVRLVKQIARFDSLLQQCSTSMTGDQASKMPQDAS